MAKGTNIKFVRKYNLYKITVYDIVYKSGKCLTRTEDELPKTAREFMDKAVLNGWTMKQYYKLLDRDEFYYMGYPRPNVKGA